MESRTTRRAFLKAFKDHGHTIVPSSPVVPHHDPTLLFTNAGMNQFKDVFLGISDRDYTRAASSQKCIRAGGKHNDLENVGHTSRHLTFFEMLGNFSFGDYFKKEAIRMAWEVTLNVFQFEKERIFATVYEEDDEAEEHWTAYLPKERIVRMGAKDNFWAMGETGPCGPCSELYYDRGPGYGAAASPLHDHAGERYIEFWNLVFMQFNRNAAGEMAPLPKQSIDTGAGLERVVALKMGARSLFETDVLRSLIKQVETVSHVAYAIDDERRAPAFHVIADHLRSLSFAIADGAQPSNVERGYVLRKILRRAVRYGRQLGMEEPFLAKILPRLVETMGDDYPELVASQDRIAEIVTIEEESFLRTLRRGGNLLGQIIADAQAQTRRISGDDAFRLKDTYGFPIEEILLIAKDAQLNVDLQRYEALEKEAKMRSKGAHKTHAQEAEASAFADFVRQEGPTRFVGYAETSAEATVKALVHEGVFVEELQAGQEGLVVLDQTPFYAEKGGQVGDTGALVSSKSEFTVRDTTEPYPGAVAHQGIVAKGALKVGHSLTAVVDGDRRQRIANNHTATHLLHFALFEVLGEHVRQAGSVVDAERLRFDFSHHKPLSEADIHRLEELVNAKVRENYPVQWYEISYEEAQKTKEIKQFFGEKYGNRVRVVDIEFSKELCGGTHTAKTGNIGYFRIAKEGSIAAGVRRIEAVTGAEAEALARSVEQSYKDAAALLKAPTSELLVRLHRLLEEGREMEKQIRQYKKRETSELAERLAATALSIKGVRFLAADAPIPLNDLKELADELMQKLPSLVLVLAAGEAEKCALVVRVSPDLVAKGIQAGKLAKAIAPLVEGSGGGKPESAQAGGRAPDKIQQALERARQIVEEAC